MNPLMVYGSAAVSVALTAPITSMFLPNVYDIRNRHATHKPDEVHLALGMGAAVALGVGLAASSATRSLAPLVGALVGVAVVAGVYEWALRYPAGGQ